LAAYQLLLRGTFSAAHRLRMYDGRLEPLHGHNWRVEVWLQGSKLDEIGVVCDFTLLQRNLTDTLAELHDTCLNDLPAFSDRNPSTEHVARQIHDRLAPLLPTTVRIAKVQVWETENCAAAFIPGD
jgi:6-pyruvoyltetrahydropterin/6-carboxytetrahydropterin synthase